MIFFLFLFLTILTGADVGQKGKGNIKEVDNSKALATENAALKQRLHKLELQKKLLERGADGLRVRAINHILARITVENASSSMIDAFLVPEVARVGEIVLPGEAIDEPLHRRRRKRVELETYSNDVYDDEGEEEFDDENDYNKGYSKRRSNNNNMWKEPEMVNDSEVQDSMDLV